MQETGIQHGSVPPAGAGRQAPDVSAKLSQLSDTAQQTMERFTHAATDAATRLGEKTHELWEAQGPAVEKARTYMREHPVATIGIAVAVGLVLSRLLTRR